MYTDAMVGSKFLLKGVKRGAELVAEASLIRMCP